MNNLPGYAESLRVGLSNIQGQGAVQLVSSLLPAIERQRLMPVGRLDLPAAGELAGYKPLSTQPVISTYRRVLPNALSRFVECLRAIPQDRGQPLLTLGDLPLRTKGRQTVFVHTPHILGDQPANSFAQALKFRVMRAVFRMNLRYVTSVVVQTACMERALVQAYPSLSGRVSIVRQPPPEWVLQHKSESQAHRLPERLKLFYPAAAYPHKNHRLVAALAAHPSASETIESLAITLDPSSQDAGSVLRSVGRLDGDAMIRHYRHADALIFPSLAESYGLPLVEAMWLGLPILCSDLPYARELCGNQAVYFRPDDVMSVLAAVKEMRDRLKAGWRPDWAEELSRIPRDWGEVARQLVTVCRKAG